MERTNAAATDFKEPVMSHLISRGTNSFQMHAQTEPSIGWGGELLLALPRALLRAIRRAWTTHKEERLLQELSDYQLRDLGIRREQISDIVRNGWER
jgi:uncharacterized protein YjiS (DUF1127 family)